MMSYCVNYMQWAFRQRPFGQIDENKEMGKGGAEVMFNFNGGKYICNKCQAANECQLSISGLSEYFCKKCFQEFIYKNKDMIFEEVGTVKRFNGGDDKEVIND